MSDLPLSQRVIKVLPEHGTLACEPIHANQLLEVAYLVMAIDRHVDDAEREAFQTLFAGLKGLTSRDEGGEPVPASQADLRTILGNFRDRTPKGEELRRIEELGAALGTPELRGVAYKIAFAMSLVDFAAPDTELELEKHVRSALHIPDTERAALRKAVFDALG